MATFDEVEQHLNERKRLRSQKEALRVAEMLGSNSPISTELAIKIKAKMALLHPEIKSVQVGARDSQLASKRIDDFALGRAAGRDAKLHTPVRAEPRRPEYQLELFA